MPASIRTAGVRADHTNWACNEKLDHDPRNHCYAFNDIRDEVCGKCKKPMAPRSEAINSRGEIIGVYEGRGVWDYDCNPIPRWACGAASFTYWP